MELQARVEATATQRRQVLQRWYRQQLRKLIPPLLEKWQTALGVQVADWRSKKMKTKWGTCTAEARRLWLNLELAKKSAPCLEYIIAHEMVHLLDRHHNDRFIALMNQHLPQWRVHREQLNFAPLAHETWSYGEAQATGCATPAGPGPATVLPDQEFRRCLVRTPPSRPSRALAMCLCFGRSGHPRVIQPPPRTRSS